MTIEVRNISKAFGKQVVLDRISLVIKKGEMLAVIGPSGTGKSVLLRIITGLMQPDNGEVLINGQSMTACRSEAARCRIAKNLGVLFQGAALFDSLTLLDNIAFPLRYRREMPETEIVKKALTRLSEVGLDGYENAFPGEVSIGMRKRVGIARALVTDPEVILFDEPNTGLDPEVGQEIYDLIKETHQEFRFTGIVISHEIPEVFQVCPRVIMLYQGIIQQEGKAEDFLLSNKAVVRQFINGDVKGPIEFN